MNTSIQSLPDFIKSPPSHSVPKTPEIKEVTVHYPATIVFWKDGTKTVTKPHGNDEWCLETAIAMAFMKKIFGRGKYLEKVACWERKNKKNLKDIDKQISQYKKKKESKQLNKFNCAMEKVAAIVNLFGQEISGG